MSEFRRVEFATLSPTHCYFCLDHVGPFLDTQVQDPYERNIYICGPHDSRPGCLGQMARLFGSPTADEAEQKAQELVEAKAQIAELEASQSVTLTYDDFVKAMKTPSRSKRTLATENTEG